MVYKAKTGTLAHTKCIRNIFRTKYILRKQRVCGKQNRKISLGSLGFMEKKREREKTEIRVIAFCQGHR